MATIIDWRNIRLHIQNILTVLYVEEGGGMAGGVVTRKNASLGNSMTNHQGYLPLPHDFVLKFSPVVGIIEI